MCALEGDRGHDNPFEYTAEAELEFQSGPEEGTKISLGPNPITLGRLPENEIVIDDPSVSRKHASISQNGSSFNIQDLGSTNGTFINQMRLTGVHLLRHGDSIRLGAADASLIFRDHMFGTQTMKMPVVNHLSSSTLISQAIMVDSKARHVYVNGKLLDPDLPRKEFDLLLLMDSRKGEAISRDEIATAVWPERPEGDVGNHEIEQCVHRVRTRIEEDTSSPKHLVTIRGYGYKLNN